MMQSLSSLAANCRNGPWRTSIFCTEAGCFAVGWNLSSSPLKAQKRTQKVDVMPHNFEPLQNDLILRTAWGRVPIHPNLKKFIADFRQARKSKELLCGLCVKVG